ncbi:hypothetical protein [Bordetella flabilis]|uniref:Uncharacterized protein n=1 Tax=Bordetella flabilis TaxID=463014 RepID=A0A193GC35_9BORD|nr:hypothetical protein [Bordetella flabilis]ANN77183.1 hypothetical protein BAU07_08730 [Bordetella flabilis]
MIRWHHVANGVMRGSPFVLQIASAKGGFVGRGAVEGTAPLDDPTVFPNEQAAVGAAAARVYAYAHAKACGRPAQPYTRSDAAQGEDDVAQRTAGFNPI